MPKKDWRDRLTEEVATNPAVAATVMGAFGAILGLTYAAMNSTPEKRQRVKEMQAQYRRDRDRREHERRQSALGFELRQSYFKNGPGRSLYDERAYLVISAGPPFPDTTVQSIAAGMGGHGFTAASASAGARLSASYNAYDGAGSFHLVRPDGSSRRGGASFSLTGLVVYPDGELDEWRDDARLMARLVAAPGTNCRQVELLRPDHADIKAAIWREYLLDNPHVAAAIGEA